MQVWWFEGALMRVRASLLAALLLCGAMLGGLAHADSISVTNGTFEQTSGTFILCGTGCEFTGGAIPGWTVTGYTGSFEPGGYLNSPLPSGSFVGYTNGGTLTQNLGVGLTPDTSYTLSVYVGNRLDGTSGAYTIELLDGSTVLCSFSGNSSTITPGGFADETCGFQTGASVPAGNISVFLTGGGGGTQFDFDNVTVSTPEPGSVALLATGLFFLAFVGWLYSRKQGFRAAV